LIASIAGNLCLLTHLISSQGPRLLFAISWILLLKKDLMVILTKFLNTFQFSRLLVILYLSNAWLYSSFHHCLKCFVILVHLVFFTHSWSIFNSRRLTTSSSLLRSDKLEVSRFLMMIVISLMKAVSSSLFFRTYSLEELMFSSTNGMVTIRGAWSDIRYYSG